MPRSWKPFARPLVVSVSPDPDLVDASDLRSRLPTAVHRSAKTVSFRPSMPVVAVGAILMNPPPLKNALMVLLLANVTDLSIVDVEFHVPEFELAPAAADPIAVADVDPPATAAAKLARSPINADLIAMASPAETDDDVISMGGTFDRLVSQGHEVHVAYQTSGNIAVSDQDAKRFLEVRC